MRTSGAALNTRMQYARAAASNLAALSAMLAVGDTRARKTVDPAVDEWRTRGQRSLGLGSCRRFRANRLNLPRSGPSLLDRMSSPLHLLDRLLANQVLLSVAVSVSGSWGLRLGDLARVARNVRRKMVA